jgi:hypothetical protein
MTDINTMFTRSLLRLGVADLKKHFPKVRAVKDAWVWKAGRDHWEFHGPDKFYWHGSAHDAYEARYKGWNAWMESKGVKL